MRERRSRRLGRDFWLYFSGQLVSQIGSAFTAFALPLLVFKVTHSATSLAVTMASNFLPYLLFGLLLGAVSDRVDRKQMMIRVDLVRGLVIAVLPVLSLAGVLRVEHIYAVAFVQSTLGILFDAGEFAAIPSLVGSDDLVVANGRVMAANSVGQIVGPVLAGALVAFLAPASLLFVDAGSFVVSAVAVSAVRQSFNQPLSSAAAEEPAVSVVRRLLRDTREGLVYVVRHPVLRSISLMMALINFVSATTFAQIVLFAKRALHASDQQVGWMFAAGAAGVVVISLTAGPLRRRLPFRVVALGALVLSGLSLTGMAWSPYPLAIVLWAAASGFGLLLNINTGALRQAIVPNNMLGRVVSIAGVLAWSAIPLGALVGAAAVQQFGVVHVYAAIGLISAAIAASFWFSPLREADRYSASTSSSGAS